MDQALVSLMAANLTFVGSHFMLSHPLRGRMVTASAMGVLALLGAYLQDRKKESLIGSAWKGWEAKTACWPRWRNLGRIGWGVRLAAAIGWLAITWLHILIANVAAGIWRWWS